MLDVVVVVVLIVVGGLHDGSTFWPSKSHSRLFEHWKVASDSMPANPTLHLMWNLLGELSTLVIVEFGTSKQCITTK